MSIRLSSMGMPSAWCLFLFVVATCTTAGLVFPAGATQVTLLLLDQESFPIEGSQFYVGGTYVAQGDSIDLSAGTYSVILYPGIIGGSQTNYLLRLDELIVEGGPQQTEEYTWRRAYLTVDLVDQTLQRIPGSQWHQTQTQNAGDSLYLPVTEDPAAPGIAGVYANGYEVSLHPGFLGQVQVPFLNRIEYAELEPSGNLHTYAWRQAYLKVDLVDQTMMRIPGSQWHQTLTVAAGDSLYLPVTEDPGTPGIAGIYADGYEVSLCPGLVGQAQVQYLSRIEYAELEPSGSLHTYAWKQAHLTVDLVDQTMVRIPGSQWWLTAYLAAGDSVYLPVTEDPTTPVLGGIFADGYLVTLYPGRSGLPQTQYLNRVEQSELEPSSSSYEYLWRQAYLKVDLVDQTMVRIPGSQWWQTEYLAAGDSVYLPVTEDPATPVLGGIFADGYLVTLYPGRSGVPQTQYLNRVEQSELEPSSSSYEYVWRQAYLKVDLVDQTMVRIPGSQWWQTEYLAAGDSVYLPVTEDPATPILGGLFADGYEVTLYPGLAGVPQRQYLNRVEKSELGPSGDSYTYIWKQAYLMVDLVDQSMARIAGSQWWLTAYMAPGDSAYLPVTEDPGTPFIQGMFADGYYVYLYPGITTHAQTSCLSRMEYAELVPTDTTAVFLWKSGIGTLHIADSTGVELLGSSFNFAYGVGAGSTGTAVHLPVTEDPGMATPSGYFAAGYSIGIRPSEAYPFTYATFELDTTYTFTPDSIIASGVECGLRLNLPAACCMETGACYLLSLTDCNNQSGTWHGDWSICDPDPCPIPTVVQVEAGNWVEPEPWHDWVTNQGEAGVPVQAQIPEHFGEIEHVEFYVSLDEGSTWELVDDVDDGYEPVLGPDSTVVMTGCGWSTSYVAPESTNAFPIQFKSVAYPDSGAPVEDIREHVYDPLPPSIGTVNLEDFQVIDQEALGIEVDPHGMTVSRIIVHLAPMEEVFTKGVPGISQQSHSQYHCAPTAAAQCLKYFEASGDTLVGAGLEPDGLVDGLAAYMSTSSSTGTLPSNWVGGIGQWVGTYGDGYTVRYYSHYGCEGGGSTWTEDDWRRVRNELERCRDVLLGIFWDGGGAHALTLNSIAYPALPNGSIVVGFKDPWTGGDATGELDPATGHVANLTAMGRRGGGQIGLTMLVSPEEETVQSGGPGEPVYDGLPEPGPGPTYEFEVALPDSGYWFVHVTLVNEEEHANRLTNIVQYEWSGVEEEEAGELIYALEARGPNPFHGRTTMAYAVPRAVEVSLKVYDVTGRAVRTLVVGKVTAGWHKVEWDGTDGLRRPVGSGIYYVRMTAEGFREVRRVTVLR